MQDSSYACSLCMHHKYWQSPYSWHCSCSTAFTEALPLVRADIMCYTGRNSSSRQHLAGCNKLPDLQTYCCICCRNCIHEHQQTYSIFSSQHLFCAAVRLMHVPLCIMPGEINTYCGQSHLLLLAAVPHSGFSSAAFVLQVCQVKELDHWMLYLVDWGYNTKQEREQAASNSRIHVVNHQQLSQAISQ